MTALPFVLAVLVSGSVPASLDAPSPSSVQSTPLPARPTPAQGLLSARSLFMLGHEEAASGQRGEALLSYERAQLLAPRDGAVAKALEQTREALGVAEPPSTWSQKAAHTLSANEWSTLALAFFGVACLALLGLAWTRRQTPCRYLLGLALAGALLAAGGALEATPDAGTAVVLHPTSLRVAPFEEADVVAPATEGSTVVAVQRHGDWVYVSAGDAQGWAPSTSVGRIIQPRSG